MIQAGFTRRITKYDIQHIMPTNLFPDRDRQIQISVSVARWILHFCNNAYRDGSGADVDEPLPTDTIGLIDNIPFEDAPTYQWASELMRFTRTLAHIIYEALRSRNLELTGLDVLNNASDEEEHEI